MRIQRGIRSGTIGAFFPSSKKKMVIVVQKEKYWLEILASLSLVFIPCDSLLSWEQGRSGLHVIFKN